MNQKTTNTNWIRYAIYVLITIGLLVLVQRILFRREGLRLEAGRIYNAKEAKQGVAIDSTHFYAIGDSVIAKYGRKSGKRVLSKKLPFKHLNGGKIINGDLVVTNNPTGHPEQNAIVWLDPETLDVSDIMKLPHMGGSLTWVDWAWDKWWVCDAYYKKNVAKTTIYCFTQDWVLEGYWELPKKVLEQIEPYSLSGGAWFGEYLCVAGHDKPELYVLRLSADKIRATLLKTIPVCFDGQGFAFERGKGAVYAWGIRRAESEVVRCAIDLDANE